MQDQAPEQTGAAEGYRLERLIGVGGMAAVYEARRLGWRGAGERVACKVMHVERPAQAVPAAERGRRRARRRELARREAVLGLRITAGHPGLVRVLDFFDDAQGAEGHRCIVMELVDGASIAELRGPDRRLSFPVIRRIACDVLDVLVYLHGLDVLHRDLSPRNVLVSRAGAVKVADLGIARVMEHGQALTRTFHGVPGYASPEALQGAALDARADLFTLGAVLFDLVAGTLPCGELTRESAIILHMVQGRYVPLPPDTPSDLAELIAGLLRTAPDQRRPQTAREALALLRGRDQPMASPAELAALVASTRDRHETEAALPAHVHPADVLAPGRVLAPHVTEEPRQRIPAFDPDARAQASDDMLQLRLRAPGRGAIARAAGLVAIVAGVVALGLVARGRWQGEPPPATPWPIEVPAPVVVPAQPVAPEAPSAITRERAELPDTRPRRRVARAVGRRQRAEVQRRVRPEPLRQPAPIGSEPPPWGTP
jgi:serine/threonine protein kinase